jgi:hypothetical protein
MLTSRQRSGINADRLFEEVGTRDWELEKKGKRASLFSDLQSLPLVSVLVFLTLDPQTLDSRLSSVL